jgi:hypothetical protein
MTDFYYEQMIRRMFREQQEWDRQMEHQGWFRRPPAASGFARRLAAIGGLLIAIGTRLQRGAQQAPLLDSNGAVEPQRTQSAQRMPR